MAAPKRATREPKNEAASEQAKQALENRVKTYQKNYREEERRAAPARIWDLLWTLHDVPGVL